MGGAGEDVGELSVNCGWGFSTVGVEPRQLNSSVGQPQHEVRRFGHVSKFCAKSRKGRTFIPIPDEIAKDFLPNAGERKRLEVRCDILYLGELANLAS